MKTLSRSLSLALLAALCARPSVADTVARDIAGSCQDGQPVVRANFYQLLGSTNTGQFGLFTNGLQAADGVAARRPSRCGGHSNGRVAARGRGVDTRPRAAGPAGPARR